MTASSALQQAVAAIRAGHMVVMVDDERRENEGDLILAAEYASQETINFMARQGCGLICLALEAAQVARLKLPPMVADNRDPRGTAFTVSIEAAYDVTTGISAAERAHTIRVAASPAASPADIVSPGHIFPLQAHPEGILGRAGHTEGAVDLMHLAGLVPASVICEIMAEDGSMMRLPELRLFAARHHLPLVTIAEMRNWIAENGREALSPVAIKSVPDPVAALPGRYGGEDMKIHCFQGEDGVEHVALVKGDPSHYVPLVRLHSECVTGDALGSLRCDCGPQLHEALARIAQEPAGILIYLRGHEGRGIGLCNKIRAYALQDEGMDTVEANEALGFPADARSWEIAGKILYDLHVSRLRLLTNNPCKTEALRQAGLEVVSTEALEVGINPFNRHYLETKRTRMGHILQGEQG